MNWVTISDITSALVAMLSQSLHGGGRLGMEGFYQLVSSAVARWLVKYSSMLGLSEPVRDSLFVFLVRALVAMLWHERRPFLRGFDASLFDRMGLLIASVIPGTLTPGFLGETNYYVGTGSFTGPVPGGVNV